MSALSCYQEEEESEEEKKEEITPSSPSPASARRSRAVVGNSQIHNIRKSTRY